MLLNNSEYLSTVEEVKKRISEAKRRALLHVNNELTNLYWNIGKTINEHVIWGNKFIENLSRDIKLEFPEATGYSIRNLKYMAKFAKLFPSSEFVQGNLAQLPWYHSVALMDKVKDLEAFVWYAGQVVENGWTRDVLVHQIDSGLYQRQALVDKTTNYGKRLPSEQSELAIQAIKDPYLFGFIESQTKMVERDIEKELISNITQLLLELGSGFAFVGNQYHLEVEGEDFYIDMLFYHLKLKCYVVIEKRPSYC